MISVLNPTNIDRSDICLYLNHVFEEKIRYNLVDTFQDIHEGIVLIQVPTNSKEYPYLDGKKDDKILYIYLTGYEYTLTINAKGCQMSSSNRPPRYYIVVDDFKDVIDSINILNNVKNIYGKIAEPKKKKYTKIIRDVEKMSSEISKADDVRTKCNTVLYAIMHDTNNMGNIPVIPFTVEEELNKLRDYLMDEIKK